MFKKFKDSTFERGKKVWRSQDEAVKPKNTQSTVKHEGGSIMQREYFITNPTREHKVGKILIEDNLKK